MTGLLRLRQRWYFFKVAWACHKRGHRPVWRVGAYRFQCSRCGRWFPEHADVV